MFSANYLPRPAISKRRYLLLSLGLEAKDGYTKVDKQFKHLEEFKWRKDKAGYVVGWIDHKDVRLHRLVTAAQKGMVVDHINHDTRDNRLANLRVCTHSENLRNMVSIARSSSEYKGVSYYKRDKNFSAQIQVLGRKKHLGYFQLAKDAAVAYDDAAKKYFGQFAHLNFKEK